MNEAVSQSDLIVPLACGLLAAVGFAAVLLRFRSRGDARDRTLPDANNPPGWVTSDSAQPPSPPAREKSGIDAVASGDVEITRGNVFYRVKEMKEQGASPDDIFKMMTEALGGSIHDTHPIMRAVAEEIFSGKSDASGFSFAANVSMSTSGGMHETLNMDKETFAKVRDMQAQGMTLDHICSDINPEYKGWEPAHQERYRNLMRTVLAFSGIHVRDI